MAGLIAKDPSQDVAGQTRQILQQIEVRLAEAGSKSPPARVGLKYRPTRPELLVEIQVIAAVC